MCCQVLKIKAPVAVIPEPLRFESAGQFSGYYHPKSRFGIVFNEYDRRKLQSTKRPRVITGQGAAMLRLTRLSWWINLK